MLGGIPTGAIDYAHSQGIVYCDLKPTNVLVANDGCLFITNFGFAELMRDTIQASVFGAVAHKDLPLQQKWSTQ